MPCNCPVNLVVVYRPKGIIFAPDRVYRRNRIVHHRTLCPVTLVDSSGICWRATSFVVASKADLETFNNRNGGLFIDGLDAEALRKAYVDQLQTLMRKEKSIGEIAESKLMGGQGNQTRSSTRTTAVDWRDLQVETHILLRDPNREHFTWRSGPCVPARYSANHAATPTACCLP